jgi:rsbT co-antagonist protein RsbR
MDELNQLKQQLAQVRAERDMLRLVVDTLPDIIYVKDAQSHHIFGNKAKLALYGADSQDVILGKTDLELHPENGAAYLASEQEMLQSRQPIINREEEVDRGDGSRGWILTTKIPFFGEDGAVLGFVGIGRDISEMKDIQRRTQEQQVLIEAQAAQLRKLSTPVIPIFDQILVLPLVGEIDETRSRDMMRSVLAGVANYRARVVIIDLTGVPLVDTHVAQNLLQCLRAARLKGANTILTGISDSVAETIVDLGVDFGDVELASSLADGLILAFQRIGVAVRKAQH